MYGTGLLLWLVRPNKHYGKNAACNVTCFLITRVSFQFFQKVLRRLFPKMNVRRVQHTIYGNDGNRRTITRKLISIEHI